LVLTLGDQNQPPVPGGRVKLDMTVVRFPQRG
jgi:hypothetical protein